MTQPDKKLVNLRSGWGGDEKVALIQISEGGKWSFRLPLPRAIAESEAEMRNRLLEFGLTVPRMHLTQPQRMVQFLMNFDGWVHNGGVAHGSELLESEKVSSEQFESWLEKVGALDHKRVWQQAAQLGESAANRQYYAIKPDLVAIATRYAMANLQEWVEITDV